MLRRKTYNLNIGVTLKIQPDRLEGVNAITRHDAGRVWVNAEAFDRSVLVPWQENPFETDRQVEQARERLL